MSLTFKERESILIAASIASGCKHCTEHHIKKAKEGNTSTDEILNVILSTQVTIKETNEIMNNLALTKHNIEIPDSDLGVKEEFFRLNELVSIATSFAVNNTEKLNHHILIARTLGVYEAEISSVLYYTEMVKKQAQKHVNKIATDIKAVVSSIENSEDGSCYKIEVMSNELDIDKRDRNMKNNSCC